MRRVAAGRLHTTAGRRADTSAVALTDVAVAPVDASAIAPADVAAGPVNVSATAFTDIAAELDETSAIAVADVAVLLAGISTVALAGKSAVALVDVARRSHAAQINQRSRKRAPVDPLSSDQSTIPPPKLRETTFPLFIRAREMRLGHL